MDPLAVLAYGAEQAPPLIGIGIGSTNRSRDTTAQENIRHLDGCCVLYTTFELRPEFHSLNVRAG